MILKLPLVDLQVAGGKLIVAHFLHLRDLGLVAVLLGLDLALSLWGILAREPFLPQAGRLQGLGLALVADLPRDLLAVLGVGVNLGLLGLGLGHQLVDLLPLEVTVLSLYWEGNVLGELVAVALVLGLADLHLDRSWAVVAVMLGDLPTDSVLHSVAPM